MPIEVVHAAVRKRPSDKAALFLHVPELRLYLERCMAEERRSLSGLGGLGGGQEGGQDGGLADGVADGEGSGEGSGESSGGGGGSAGGGAGRGGAAGSGSEGGSFNTGLITGGGLGTLIGVRDFIALATGCDIGKEGCLEFARGVVSCAKKMAAVSEMDMQVRVYIIFSVAKYLH